MAPPAREPCAAWPGLTISIGRAHVIDGDTLEIHGTRIRLWGIDAAGERSAMEQQQQRSLSMSAAGAAASALAGLLYAIPRPLICTPTGQDQYGRTIAVCSPGALGPDISHWLVSNGYALDSARSCSKRKITKSQSEAEQANRKSLERKYVSRGSLASVCLVTGTCITRHRRLNEPARPNEADRRLKNWRFRHSGQRRLVRSPLKETPEVRSVQGKKRLPVP